jgi:nitroreductase
MIDSPDILRRLRRIHQTRDYADTPVTPEQLQAILDVARWTGSARNVQPWELLVVDDPADLAWLAGISPSSGFFAKAPLVILPLVDAGSPTPELDRGRLIERLFIAADALGLAAGIGSFPPGTREDVARYLGIPDAAAIYCGIALGTPAPRPAGASGSGGRKPLTDLVHYARYGSRTRSGVTS